MSISQAEVQKIANMAKLRIDDARATQLSGDLSNILTHAESLSKYSTVDVHHTAWSVNIPRQDEEKIFPYKKELLQETNLSTEQNQIKAPKTI